MSEETRKRSSEEIEADLAAKRLELTHNVDALVGRIDPRKRVSEFVDEVKDGKPRAVSILGGVGAAVAGIVGVAILRRNR